MCPFKMPNNFLNIILIDTLASNMSIVHSICHVWFFCYWIDGRDHFKNSFLFLVITLVTKSILGPQ